MTSPNFLEALQLAMAETSTRDSITHIKAAAIQGLEALDPRARIHSTDYFNHSFAPDLVLTWSHQSQRERFVYLRLTDSADYLAEDVERTASQRPIIFDLATTPERQGRASDPRDDRASSRLSQAARGADTLVTDPRAVNQLVDAKAQTPVVGLLSSALAQGGSGVVGVVEATDVSNAVSRGFVGAREVGTQAVLDASEALASVLDPRLTGRMNRLLQAVWVGSGARLDLFPAAKDLTGDLDRDSLSFLLEQAEIADLDFWRRVGQGVDLAQISGLPNDDGAPNLQHLITANLGHLWARACRVVDADPELGEDEHAPMRWVVRRKALAVRTSGFFAYLGERTEDLDEIKGTPTDGISVEEMGRRAGDVPIQSVLLTDGREAIDFTSVANENVMDSEHLAAVEASLHVSAKIRRARAVLPGGKQLTCDFAGSAVTSINRATFSLPEILGTGLPLLRGLTDDERQQLDDLLDDPFKPATLFDQQDDDGDGQQTLLTDASVESVESSPEPPEEGAGE